MNAWGRIINYDIELLPPASQANWDNAQYSITLNLFPLLLIVTTTLNIHNQS